MLVTAVSRFGGEVASRQSSSTKECHANCFENYWDYAILRVRRFCLSGALWHSDGAERHTYCVAHHADIYQRRGEHHFFVANRIGKRKHNDKRYCSGQFGSTVAGRQSARIADGGNLGPESNRSSESPRAHARNLPRVLHNCYSRKLGKSGNG